MTTVLVKVAQCDNNKQAQSNMLFVSQAIYNQLVGNNSSNDVCIVSIKGYLFSIAVDNTITSTPGAGACQIRYTPTIGNTNTELYTYYYQTIVTKSVFTLDNVTVRQAYEN